MHGELRPDRSAGGFDVTSDPHISNMPRNPQIALKYCANTSYCFRADGRNAATSRTLRRASFAIITPRTVLCPRLVSAGESD